MTGVLIALLTLSFTSTANAQTHVSPGDAPNVIVLKKTWRKSRYTPGWDRIDFPTGSASSGRGDPNSPPTVGRRRWARATDGYTYEAKVKNAGPKAIRVLGWDYVFIDPIDGRSTHHQFFDQTKIGPGKKKGLTKFIKAPPTRTVRASVKLLEEVVINYVEYQDGSKWRARE